MPPKSKPKKGGQGKSTRAAAVAAKALGQAAFDGDASLLQVLLGGGLDPDSVDSDDPSDHPPLLTAIVEGHTECVKVLLAKGADANATTSVGCRNTALSLATILDNDAMVALLLGAGAAVHALDDDGNSAIAMACASGSTSCLRLLLQAGADTSAFYNGETALQIATKNSHAACVELLTSSSRGSATFDVGQQVQIVGLVGSSELNGTMAVVRGFLPEKGRYSVELLSKEGMVVALKPANLATGAGVVAATLGALKEAAKRCACCGGTSGTGGGALKMCGQCKQEGVATPLVYCGTDCARKDWRASHKDWHSERAQRASGIEKAMAKHVAELKRSEDTADIDSDDYDVLLAAGNEAIMTANGLKMAVKQYKKAIKLNSTLPQAYCSLATVLQMEREFGAAATTLQEGLMRLEPDTEQWGHYTGQLVHILAQVVGKWVCPRPETRLQQPAWFVDFSSQLEMAKRCTKAAPGDSLLWSWRASLHAFREPISSDASRCWKRAASAAAQPGSTYSCPSRVDKYLEWAREAEAGENGPYPGGGWEPPATC